MARHTQSTRRRCLPWAVRLVVAALAVGAWYLCSRSSGWLSRALVSPRFMINGAIVLVGAMVVQWLVALLARWGRCQRAAGSPASQAGAAMVEFVLVMPILLMIVLILAQTAFVLVGTVAVNYAGFCAARSAVVYIPADMTYASGEEANYVYFDSAASIKMRHIREAAVWAVMPVSGAHPSLSESGGLLVSGAAEQYESYGMDVPRWLLRVVGRKMAYAEEYTTVELEEPDGGEYYGEKELIGVHVRHQLYLGIPYGNQLYAAMDPTGQSLAFDGGVYSVEIHALGLLPNEGVRDYIEEETFDPP